VVVQFSLSTILIIGSISMFKQLRHIKEIDLGFNGEEVLVIPDAVKLGDKLEVFQTELSRLSFVDNSSGLLRLPGEEGSPIKVEMSTDSGDRFYVDQFIGDTQMLDVLGVELLYGQFFSDSLKASNTTIVINETMASYLDTDQVLGTNFDGYEVIGVVEDFHFGSLREQIGPLIFSQSSRSKALAIKMPINQTNIASIERLWQSMSGLPMKYYPLEDNYEAIVGKEYSTGQAFSLFTILAIFISCLGMYGLTAFAADQRAKEFGIRKVLGASMGDLVKTLTNSLSKLMLISFVLAVPLSYLAVNKWLSDFAYRIEMTSIIFLVGCFIVLVLITLTVFHQSYKVVVKNPVDSLKND